MTKSKIIEGIKTGLGIVAGLGITLLCSAFAGNVASSSNSGAVKKAIMGLGGAIIGGMVANQAEKHINASVDSVASNFEEIQTTIRNARAKPTEDVN